MDPWYNVELISSGFSLLFVSNSIAAMYMGITEAEQITQMITASIEEALEKSEVMLSMSCQCAVKQTASSADISFQ